MSTMIKMMSVLFILNIFMYVGVNFSMSADGENNLNKNYNFHFNGDLIDTFIKDQGTLDTMTQDYKENWTSYGIEFEGNFTGIPDQQAGISTGQGGIVFLDPLRILWSFVKTMGNVAVAPLTLFFNFNMPVLIGLMIGIPYFIILVLTIFAFIRGVSD